LLDQKDIDGVIVGTNDHARVLCAIHAVQAGKDGYAEKPLSLYVAEGRMLVRAARKYNRILQVGSQQRSMAMNRVACDFVRNGGLGRIRMVLGANYPPSTRVGPMPDEPAPTGMNWDMRLGQAEKRPFNSELFTHWMRYWDYSGGETTNSGAHGIGQVQSALGMDTTGPVEFHPLEDSGQYAVGWRYANGVKVRLELPNAGNLQGGAIFVGE
jgi:predicted dehydrogenase